MGCSDRARWARPHGRLGPAVPEGLTTAAVASRGWVWPDTILCFCFIHNDACGGFIVPVLPTGNRIQRGSDTCLGPHSQALEEVARALCHPKETGDTAHRGGPIPDLRPPHCLPAVGLPSVGQSPTPDPWCPLWSTRHPGPDPCMTEW